MSIKVVVFGVEEVVKLVNEVGREFNDIILINVIYYHPNEIKELVEKHQFDGDALFFCAPIPYLVALDFQTTNEIKYNKPMIFLPHIGETIYPFLLNFFIESKVFLNDDSAVSLDYPINSKIKDCLDSLNIDRTKIYELIQESYLNIDIEKVFLFHYNLWKQNKIVACATVYYSVYKELKTLGIPTHFIKPTLSDITHAFHQLISEVRNISNAKSQIAIGIIKFNPIEDPNNRAITEYEMNRKKLALQQLLLDYVERFQALIHWTNNDQAQFITTRGEIERNTNFFKEIDILLEIRKKLNIPSSFGIGFGRTANEAKINAHEALLKAEADGKYSCFAIEVDGTVYGPIGKEQQLKYSIRSDDPSLIRIAKHSNLSVGTLNKLIAFWMNLDRSSFTTLDLASGFGITLRSARRILNQLEKNNYAKVIGEEQPIGRGRPRYLYTLQFTSVALK